MAKAAWGTPAHRILALTLALAACCATFDVLFVTPLRPLPGLPADLPRLAWPTLTLGYIAFQIPTLRVRVRGGVFSLVPTELPFVIGLLLVDPAGLVVARALARLLVAGALERRQPTKAAFNVIRATVVASTGVVIYRAVLGPGGPFSARGWAAVLAALVATEFISAGLVAGAILTARARLVAPFSAADASFALLTTLASGVLAMLGVITARWSSPALAVFAVVGVLVLVAIRRSAGLRLRYKAMAALYEFTRDVYEIAEPHERIDTILRRLRNMFQAAAVGLVQFGPGEHVSLVHLDWDQEQNPERTDAWANLDAVLRLAAAQARRHALTGEALVTALHAAGLTDVLAAPLADGGEAAGFIAVCFDRGEGHTVDDSEGELLQMMSRPITIALQRDRLLSEVRREAAQRAFEATHDALTGLANRALLAQELQLAVQSTAPLALLLIDLDHFKEVNDTLGHDSGDLLLIAAAARLRQALGRGETVARLGGDEFAVLAREWTSTAEVVALGLRLCTALRAPYLIQGLSVEVTASIGIAVASKDSPDATTLLRCADVAMYQAKRERADALLYEPAFDRHSRPQLTLAADLRSAVAEGRFSAVFQPIIALSDSRPLGAEALARWSDPRFSHLGPDTFIPLAEHAGLIGPLTWLVLSQALERCAAWQAEGVDGGVHVNLSVLSLVDPNLLARVSSALEAADLSPHLLTLEITEGSLIADFDQAGRMLQRLRNRGIKIAIDDFGAGQSSLAYLQRLSVDIVKLDKSLIAGIATAPAKLVVVGSAIELAHALGLEVIAEGVEDIAVWDQLAALGCDAAQGRFLAPPLTSADIGAWWPDHTSPLGTP